MVTHVHPHRDGVRLRRVGWADEPDGGQVRAAVAGRRPAPLLDLLDDEAASGQLRWTSDFQTVRCAVSGHGPVHPRWTDVFVVSEEGTSPLVWQIVLPTGGHDLELFYSAVNLDEPTTLAVTPDLDVHEVLVEQPRHVLCAHQQLPTREQYRVLASGPAGAYHVAGGWTLPRISAAIAEWLDHIGLPGVNVEHVDPDLAPSTPMNIALFDQLMHAEPEDMIASPACWGCTFGEVIGTFHVAGHTGDSAIAWLCAECALGHPPAS